MPDRLDPAQVSAPAHPGRRVARTMLATLTALAPILPTVVDALGVPRTLPVVALLLGAAAGVTRALALPQVEVFLRRHAPWLSAGDVAAEDVVAQVVDRPSDPSSGAAATTVVVAGEAHPEPTGTELPDTVLAAAPARRPRRKPAKRAR